MKPLGKVLRYLRKHGLITLGAYVSLLLATSANLASPRLLQVLIDRGISAGDMRTIVVMALILVGVAPRLPKSRRLRKSAQTGAV